MLRSSCVLFAGVLLLNSGGVSGALGVAPAFDGLHGIDLDMPEPMRPGQPDHWFADMVKTGEMGVVNLLGNTKSMSILLW